MWEFQEPLQGEEGEELPESASPTPLLPLKALQRRAAESPGQQGPCTGLEQGQEQEDWGALSPHPAHPHLICQPSGGCGEPQVCVGVWAPGLGPAVLAAELRRSRDIQVCGDSALEWELPPPPPQLHGISEPTHQAPTQGLCHHSMPFVGAFQSCWRPLGLNCLEGLPPGPVVAPQALHLAG